MKNIVKLFSMFMIMVGTFAFGQSKEDVQRALSETMIQVKNGTEEAFINSKSYEGFKDRLIHQREATTKEGENILKKVYEFHSKKASDREILTKYDGKEIAYGLKKLKEIGQLDHESVLFSKTGIETNLTSKRDYPCKWYQLRCHLTQIFGESGADTIITAIVTWIAELIK